MRFNKTDVWGFEHAIRGARNPLESWSKSDSVYEKNPETGMNEYILGLADLGLMQRLIRASQKEGNSHSKFLRQIMVSVDITAPMYWWSEFDTYKVGTVANSTSKMHKLATTPITLKCFEQDDLNDSIEVRINEENVSLNDLAQAFIKILDAVRKKYLETKDATLWKELIRWLPESWLQTRTVTLNYQVLRQMYFDRRNHKLTEWSRTFVNWIDTLPYANELIKFESRRYKDDCL